MLNGGRTRDNGKGNRADLYFHSYAFTVSFINIDVNFTTTKVKTTKNVMSVLSTGLSWRKRGGGGGCTPCLYQRDLLKMVGAGNVPNDRVENTSTTRGRCLLHQVQSVHQTAG